MRVTYLAALLVFVVLDGVYSRPYQGNSRCSQFFRSFCRKKCFKTEVPLIVPRPGAYCRRGICCGPVNSKGVLAKWSRWSTCSVTCGIGQRRRTRRCIAGICLGQVKTVTKACKTGRKCPTPSKWGAWSPWSKCSCETGKERSSRVCRSGVCVQGNAVRTRSCSRDGCSFPGPSWQEWGEWSSCSASCDQGTRVRYRRCSGQICLGSGKVHQTETCFIQSCQVVTSPPPPTRKYCSQRATSRAIGAVNVSDCSTDPWTVSFQLIGEAVHLHICSGVLVSRNHVLTTKRCGESLNISSPGYSFYAVVEGLGSEGQIQPVGDIKVFGDAEKESVGVDLAIVNIPGEFAQDVCATPVCLPLATETFNTGHSCVMTGWRSGDKQEPPTFVLPVYHQSANVTFMSTTDCKNTKSSPEIQVFHDTVCTNSTKDGVATCESDNGWSLICNDDYNQPTLLGLAMAEPEMKCSTDHPSRFQSVQMHLDWITEVVLGE